MPRHNWVLHGLYHKTFNKRNGVKPIHCPVSLFVSLLRLERALPDVKPKAQFRGQYWNIPPQSVIRLKVYSLSWVRMQFAGTEIWNPASSLGNVICGHMVHFTAWFYISHPNLSYLIWSGESAYGLHEIISSKTLDKMRHSGDVTFGVKWKIGVLAYITIIREDHDVDLIILQ